MTTFADLIAQAKDIGIFQFYLPFILMFAIFYGLLDRAKIFGKDSTGKRINLIIALSFSAFLLIATPVGPAALDLSTFLANFAQGTLLVVITILVFLVVLAMLVVPTGKDITNVWSDVKWIIIAAIILAVGVYASSGGLSLFPGISFGTPGSAPVFQFPGLSSSDLALVVVFVLTALVVIYAASSGGEKSSEEKKGK